MEEWRDIPGFEERYQVSNLGRVKSFCGIDERILKLSPDKNGYLHVNLHRHVTIHQLVAEVFLGKSEPDKETNHKDGNKQNNSLDNLEYVTHIDNMRHAFKNGLIKKRRNKSYINIFTKNGEFVIQTKSMSSAIKWVRENTEHKKANSTQLARIIKGKHKKRDYGGLIFEKTFEKR